MTARLPLVSDCTTVGSPRPARALSKDWRWQLRKSARTVEDLDRALSLTDEERRGAERAMGAGLPIGITPYYLSLADPGNPECPIRKQCVPTAREDEEVPGDLSDPLGEAAHEVAPYLVQRYPDRALLLATDQCAVYCRFCTRSRVVGAGVGPTPLGKLAQAFSYLAAHPEIRDVIVSGGDPLSMATPKLAALLRHVRQIPHVETIRLATRVPVTMPMRIDRELCRELRPLHPIWVMTHFNHPKELTKDAVRACTRLADAGFPIMNQTVLLRGINDNVSVLESLFRGLVRARVRPYYLLQADPVRGTGHLRTPLSRGMALLDALQGRVSGLMIPRLICDTPGGKGKVPVGMDYVVRRDGLRTTLRTFRGEEVDYVDPPH